MDGLFADLLLFFGISGSPSTFADFVPWFMSVLVSIGFVLACFRLVNNLIGTLLRADRF